MKEFEITKGISIEDVVVWTDVLYAYDNDMIDFEIIKRNAKYFAIVTDLSTGKVGWEELKGTKTYQRKDAIMKAFEQLGL